MIIEVRVRVRNYIVLAPDRQRGEWFIGDRGGDLQTGYRERPLRTLLVFHPDQLRGVRPEIGDVVLRAPGWDTTQRAQQVEVVLNGILHWQKTGAIDVTVHES